MISLFHWDLGWWSGDVCLAHQVAIGISWLEGRPSGLSFMLSVTILLPCVSIFMSFSKKGT